MLVAGSLRAQAPGIPVMNAGVSRGISFGGMAGFPNHAAGDGTSLQASVTLGARRIAIEGFASRFGDPADPGTDRTAGGGAITLKVLGGPLVPVAVNLQAGVGYWQSASGIAADPTKNWHVPVGLGISWTIPRPVVAVKPWIAPRLDYSRVDVPTGSLALVDASATNFGLSGGLSFGFLNGLALDVALDRVFTSGLVQKPTTFGAGVSFTFK
jgi:hypothetical protein